MSYPNDLPDIGRGWLAIFSRVYSETGFISEAGGVISDALVLAVESGIRGIINLAKLSVTEKQYFISLEPRRFYEADIFGGKWFF